MTLFFTHVMAQQHQIPFKVNPQNNLMVVKGTINDNYIRNFFWDTGASVIVINEGLFNAMIKNGDIDKSDVVGKTTTSLADGRTVDAIVVKLKSFTIGNFTANNIETLVLPGNSSDFLIGQNIFQKFGAITIDYNKELILLNSSGNTLPVQNPQNIASLNEVRIVACSNLKQNEISSIRKDLSTTSFQINNITEETKIPPQKAIDRIQAEYVVRYFDDNSEDVAEKIKELLEKNVKGQVLIENMLLHYNAPIVSYIEIWIK